MIPSGSNGDSNAIIPSNGDTQGFTVEQVHSFKPPAITREGEVEERREECHPKL